MKLFLNIEKKLTLSQWSIIVILFAFSILSSGDHIQNSLERIDDFQTEWILDLEKEDIFQLDELAKKKLVINDSNLFYFGLFENKPFPNHTLKVQFKQLSKDNLSFDKPIFFFQKRIPTNYSDELPSDLLFL